MEIYAEQTQTADGRVVYTIRRYTVDDGTGSLLVDEYVIEPKSGYLITEAKYYDESGIPFREVHVKAEEFADGVWFPVEIEDLTETNDLYALVERIAVNEPVDKSQFELEALGFDKETIHIVHISRDGIGTLMEYVDGTLVPMHSRPPPPGFDPKGRRLRPQATPNDTTTPEYSPPEAAHPHAMLSETAPTPADGPRTDSSQRQKLIEKSWFRILLAVTIGTVSLAAGVHALRSRR